MSVKKRVRPGKTGGMRHVALFVDDLAACEHFYTELLGMEVEWRPDEQNVYLTSGNDNLALHQAAEPAAPAHQQKLDHIGFIIPAIEEVDDWFEFLTAHDVSIRNPPRTHRDGARSFYCYDPSGTVVQIIYHPPIS
ncbi:ring-cleaving dioxygenase [Methylophaga thalassica]|uniref:Ring-cleaving dioxygenase n=1 Tax=Methylophaga thalassica TaxID=40223 RepID=A0ABQ5TUN6_9GAMM|nr:VOC family protein [Methylophaga thalassica]GLP98883.1 ring-cleaving dioxygenase [Methylophaga thalassica]